MDVHPVSVPWELNILSPFFSLSTLPETFTPHTNFTAYKSLFFTVVPSLNQRKWQLGYSKYQKEKLDIALGAKKILHFIFKVKGEKNQFLSLV